MMGLNKSKGNMYSWITHTWNPLGGQCPHGCTYCSTGKLMRYPALKAKYTGHPRLIEKELSTNLGNGRFIFVAAQNDLFANNIPNEWIKRVLDHCRKFDNRYLFQSKNPMAFLDFQIYFDFLRTVFCTTIETNRHYPDIMQNCPLPRQRATALSRLPIRYVTIEPIMDFDLDEMVELIKICKPQQVNIGADSGNNGLPEPSIEKVYQLIERLEKFTIIAKKSNLRRLEK